LDPDRLHINCPSAKLVSAGNLPGYRLDFTKTSEKRWRGGVADIVQDSEANVWGGIWLISESESDALDRQEGVHLSPQGYHRLEVKIRGSNGRQYTCRTYEVSSREGFGLLPSPAYKSTLVRGSRYCDLPSDYQIYIGKLPDNGNSGGDPNLSP
jgi:gamma-glutamylcyclotransferase (GGCT)/AIG2-like uncharacterized protein YtfP